MNEWISQSVDLLTTIANFIISPPAIYITGTLFLIIVCKLFKDVVR